MAAVFTTAFQVRYLAATVVLFVVVALLTRARWRRLAGALCSVAVFTAISAPIDDFGHATGLWTYPSCIDPPHPPIAIYIGQALELVGCLALIGWRVQRRFGTRGLVAMSAVVCTLGPVRDFAVAAVLPDLMRMGPLPGSLVADVAAWAVVLLVALGVTRLVAGPS